MFIIAQFCMELCTPHNYIAPGKLTSHIQSIVNVNFEALNKYNGCIVVYDLLQPV